MKIAFDVDGTLIDYQSNPRHEVIDLLRAFAALGFQVYVWSGSGSIYATTWVRRLGISPFIDGVLSKTTTSIVDYAVDDMPDADLGSKGTIIIPPKAE